MYGTTLTNAQIRQLKRLGVVKIDPFKEENLKLAHYRLRPRYVRKLLGEQGPTGEHALSPSPVFDFQGGAPFEFEGGEYVVVTIMEQVILGDGLVAEVIPASTLVTQGFALVAGKLDAGYGRINDERQDFVVGLKNLLDTRNLFYPSNGIANMVFHDFRGTNSDPVGFSESERRTYRGRSLSDEEYLRSHGDGPTHFYE